MPEKCAYGAPRQSKGGKADIIRKKVIKVYRNLTPWEMASILCASGVRLDAEVHDGDVKYEILSSPLGYVYRVMHKRNAAGVFVPVAVEKKV